MLTNFCLHKRADRPHHTPVSSERTRAIQCCVVARGPRRRLLRSFGLDRALRPATEALSADPPGPLKSPPVGSAVDKPFYADKIYLQ